MATLDDKLKNKHTALQGMVDTLEPYRNNDNIREAIRYLEAAKADIERLYQENGLAITQ